MKKVVRLRENDLVRLVKKIVKEQSVLNSKFTFEDMEIWSDSFRKFVNSTFPNVAKKLNLSTFGPISKDIIKKAWTYELNMGDTNDKEYIYKTLGDIFTDETIPKTGGLKS